jgi:hypothetical protein
VLDEAAIPVGVVTGIRGNSRLLDARCVGEYSHCGGVPRARRHDAVVATAELVSALDAVWTEHEAAGVDFAFTVGKVITRTAHTALHCWCTGWSTNSAGVDFAFTVGKLFTDAAHHQVRSTDAQLTTSGHSTGAQRTAPTPQHCRPPYNSHWHPRALN